MPNNALLSEMQKAVIFSLFCVFRAQFGQNQSFNSLSHKNLIMNMEPLVPAMPSTNEYEETVTDNGNGITYSTYTQADTHSCPPVTDLWKVTWVSPSCMKKHMYMHNTLRVLIEQLMLPSLHLSCLPWDTNLSMLKIPLPWSSLQMQPCLCVCLCVHLCDSEIYWGRYTVWHDAIDPAFVIIKENWFLSY